MHYTVCSRGRPIGVTALEFVRFDTVESHFRSGWLHPNPEGEQVLEVVGALVPAMRAFLDRNRPAGGRPGASRLTDDRRSTACADVYEALHRVDALDLSLHHPDGTAIPTAMVVVQDCDRLLALARDVSFDADDPFDGKDPSDGADFFDSDDPFGDDDRVGDDSSAPWAIDRVAPEGGPQAIELTDAVAAGDESWAPEKMPRYQIHVELADGVELP